MLSIENLQFAYPARGFHLTVPALSVARAEKVALIGPSGSGKTTLLKLIAGILPARQGTIAFGDERVDGMNDRERRRFRSRRIGFVFQDFELVDYLSVLDNILHPCRISSALVLDRAARAKARALAERMDIEDKLRRYPGALSQGERQRVAICRCLLPEPGLILADEATGNLDPDNKQHILDLLFEAVDSGETALLAVTHDHELLPRFDRVVDFASLAEQVA